MTFWSCLDFDCFIYSQFLADNGNWGKEVWLDWWRWWYLFCTRCT
jgi:hypothetical protein